MQTTLAIRVLQNERSPDASSNQSHYTDRLIRNKMLAANYAMKQTLQ